MLTAAICGDVFASPPVDSILAVCKLLILIISSSVITYSEVYFLVNLLDDRAKFFCIRASEL